MQNDYAAEKAGNTNTESTETVATETTQVTTMSITQTTQAPTNTESTATVANKKTQVKNMYTKTDVKEDLKTAGALKFFEKEFDAEAQDFMLSTLADLANARTFEEMTIALVGDGKTTYGYFGERDARGEMPSYVHRLMLAYKDRAVETIVSRAEHLAATATDYGEMNDLMDGLRTFEENVGRAGPMAKRIFDARREMRERLTKSGVNAPQRSAEKNTNVPAEARSEMERLAVEMEALLAQAKQGLVYNYCESDRIADAANALVKEHGKVFGQPFFRLVGAQSAIRDLMPKTLSEKLERYAEEVGVVHRRIEQARAAAEAKDAAKAKRLAEDALETLAFLREEKLLMLRGERDEVEAIIASLESAQQPAETEPTPVKATVSVPAYQRRGAAEAKPKVEVKPTLATTIVAAQAEPEVVTSAAQAGPANVPDEPASEDVLAAERARIEAIVAEMKASSRVDVKASKAQKKAAAQAANAPKQQPKVAPQPPTAEPEAKKLASPSPEPAATPEPVAQPPQVSVPASAPQPVVQPTPAFASSAPQPAFAVAAPSAAFAPHLAPLVAGLTRAQLVGVRRALEKASASIQKDAASLDLTVEEYEVEYVRDLVSALRQ